jgi:DNA mismatch repair protein MutL
MRIKQLSLLVASQIAAGEVIERPASVLKELLENSIDAGSNTITVEIEQGGLKLIRIRDNGNGIHKDDLALALLQHATSKISRVEDLDGINSLGFRGEALASIAAVSQLELISKPKKQEMAWEFKTDGNAVLPASHNDGTTVTVRNLFYNVPARRKFLRSEHAEFNYLEDLFKRMALSQFAITFSLLHDGKKIKYLPACSDELAKAKRLAMLCGNRMLEQSIYLDAEQNGLRLWGWLGSPTDARSNSSNQFFYINQRMVKDKLINHAVKQVYQSYCAPGKYPTYCLYFELDVKALDVNVHPTKHEVRFRDARVVHAFLTKVLEDALSRQAKADSVLPIFAEALPMFSVPLKMEQDKLTTVLSMPSLDGKEKSTVISPNEVHFSKEIENSNAEINNCINNSHIENYSSQVRILCIIGNNKLILAEQAGKIFLIDVKASKDRLLINAFEQLFLSRGHIPAQPILIPKTITLTKDKEITDIMHYTALFAELGFNLDQIGTKDIIFRTLPLPLAMLEIDCNKLITNLVKLFKELKIVVSEKSTSSLLSNIIFIQSIKILLSSIIYPGQLNVKDALQLAVDIISLPVNQKEKLTFKQCSLQELHEFVYE